jgi:hypothetical protein
MIIDIEKLVTKTDLRDKNDLTDRVYIFMINFLKNYHFPPTLPEIAIAMDHIKGSEPGHTSKSVANWHLSKLIEEGRVEKVDDQNRKVRVQGRIYIPAVRIVDEETTGKNSE